MRAPHRVQTLASIAFARHFSMIATMDWPLENRAFDFVPFSFGGQRTALHHGKKCHTCIQSQRLSRSMMFLVFNLMICFHRTEASICAIDLSRTIKTHSKS